MIESSIKYCSTISLFLFSSLSTSAWACDGQERREAMRILHETFDAGYQAGLTLNFQGLAPKIEQLSRQTKKLSPSCQALVQQINDSLGPVYDPNTTRCSGTVCCDDSSCYTN